MLEFDRPVSLAGGIRYTLIAVRHYQAHSSR